MLELSTLIVNIHLILYLLTMIEEIKIEGITYKLIEDNNGEDCSICDLYTICRKHTLMDICRTLNDSYKYNTYYKKQ